MTSEVRVRFCPSPTGTPHVGLVRSCLFNWAYAKNTRGKFVFRIEDTDAQRDSDDSYHMILDALKWLGLLWDEGVEVGGPDAPYRQSQRYDIYAEVVQKLLDAGYAYKSFSTKEEIDARNKSNGRPLQFGYDGFDRTLSAEQITEYEQAGREATIRIKMPDEDITFTDLVRGEITFKAGQVPDYVIVRGNGDPLYTLVNPVDDALMRITHVLRGEDLLSSTPRQIVLHKYLREIGISTVDVQFGHLPYVMGEGNKKLSKRDPESNLFLHRELGILPEGLINYLALLGWSLSPDRDVFDADELVANFDIADVLANPARFDMKKCTAINAEHIRRLDVDDFKQRLVPYLHGSVSKKYVDLELVQKIAAESPELPRLQTFPALTTADEFAELTPREQEIITKAAPLIQTRIQVLSEAREMLAPLLSEDDVIEIDEDANAQLEKIDNYAEVLSAGLSALQAIAVDNWTTEVIKNALTYALSAPSADADAAEIVKFTNSLGLKPRIAFTPLRVAISGKRISPPLFECMDILGKVLTCKRIENIIKKLSN